MNLLDSRLDLLDRGLDLVVLLLHSRLDLLLVLQRCLELLLVGQAGAAAVA